MSHNVVTMFGKKIIRYHHQKKLSYVLIIKGTCWLTFQKKRWEWLSCMNPIKYATKMMSYEVVCNILETIN